jgi:hypothetical protein
MLVLMCRIREHASKWVIGYGSQLGRTGDYSSVVTPCFFTDALVEKLPPALSPPAPSADTAAGPLPPLAHRVAAAFPRVLTENRSQVPCLEQTCVVPGE